MYVHLYESSYHNLQIPLSNIVLLNLAWKVVSSELEQVCVAVFCTLVAKTKAGVSADGGIFFFFMTCLSAVLVASFF